MRPFTYRDLLAMERSGIIGEDERVELLGGRIYRMTIKPPHAWAVSSLTQKFSVAFDGCATVASQQPLPLSDDLDATELPQPDAMLLQEGTYPDHPRPHHVLLLVEVSDSTLRKDTAIKLPLYAQVGIPELWIINLVQRRIEVYIPTSGPPAATSAPARSTNSPRRLRRRRSRTAHDSLHDVLEHQERTATDADR